MSAYISNDLKRRVRAHFANCCAYCRTAEELVAVTFEFDHIRPLIDDGETVFDNLCLACPMCNRHKAHRTTIVDPVTREAVALFRPHRDQWSNHFEWNEDSTELVGLTATGEHTIATLKMNRPKMIRLRAMWVAIGKHPPE